MNFSEASKELLSGQSIRRKAWNDKIHLKIIEIPYGRVQGFREESVPFKYDNNIITSDDWVVLGDEDIQIPFSVAIEKLKKRFKLKLPRWPSQTYIEVNEHGDDLIMHRICEFEYVPTFECFCATDWEVIP